MSESSRRLKEEMVKVYGFKCWIDDLWIPGKKNILTFHHILEKRNGGIIKWENGALLSLYRHDYLNYLDLYYHSIYNELNGLFYDLNRTYAPPTDEYYEEVKRVLRRIK